jgi:hypothetical protein
MAVWFGSATDCLFMIVPCNWLDELAAATGSSIRSG